MTALTIDPSQPPSAPAAQAEIAINVDASNFIAEVMEASKTQLVIVDFWAPWCGPCKQLGPILEKIISKTNGAAKLVKIDIDKSPQIAQQLRVQSIPTVFAFFNKQVVDGFMGVQPESQLAAWLVELIKATGAKPPTARGDGYATALTQAAEFFQNGDVDTALAIYGDILAEVPTNIEAFSGALRCHLAKGETDRASDMLDHAMPELANHKSIAPLRTQLALALEAKNKAGDTAPLLKKIEEDPNDHQARFDLAMAYYGSGDTESAIDCLMEMIRLNRKWNGEAARTQLVKVFETLGFDHPLAVQGRKQLSSILFS